MLNLSKSRFCRRRALRYRRGYGTINNIKVICGKGGGRVADSNITKRALASALRELAAQKPFSKISIGDICETCEMNRKSFYYHFRDKYELVNWIFFTEFVAEIQRAGAHGGHDALAALCAYLGENRAFYRKVLSADGQDPFTAYFREMLGLLVTDALEQRFAGPDFAFYCDFYLDALVCAMRRWLSARDAPDPAHFAAHLARCVSGA